MWYNTTMKELDIKAMRDTRGVLRTRSLFVQFVNEEGTYQDGTPCKPLFSMEDYEVGGCPSFKKLYVSLGDPTEYKQAIAMLGSVEHWDYLLKSPFMEPLIKACRKELALKIESEAFDGLLAEARGASQEASRISAYKTVLKEAQDLNEEKVAKKVKPRGRPSQADITASLKEMTAEEKRLHEDHQRIRPTSGETKEDATKH